MNELWIGEKKYTTGTNGNDTSWLFWSRKLLPLSRKNAVRLRPPHKHHQRLWLLLWTTATALPLRHRLEGQQECTSTGNESEVNFLLNSTVEFSVTVGSWTKNGEEQIIYDATQSRYWKFQDSKPDVVEEGSCAQDGERKMRGRKNKTKHEDDGNDDDDGKWEWRAGLNCIAFIGGDGRKKRVVQRKDGRKRNSSLGDITRYTLNEDNNLLFGKILRFLLSILPLFCLCRCCLHPHAP